MHVVPKDYRLRRSELSTLAYINQKPPPRKHSQGLRCLLLILKRFFNKIYIQMELIISITYFLCCFLKFIYKKNYKKKYSWHFHPKLKIGLLIWHPYGIPF